MSHLRPLLASVTAALAVAQVWAQCPSFTPLPVLDSQSHYPTNISGDGNVVVGYREGQVSIPVRWIGTDDVDALTLPPSAIKGTADGVNYYGSVIAGTTDRGTLEPHATRWIAGVPEQLPKVQPAFIQRDWAYDASDDGLTIVGGYCTTQQPTDCNGQPLLWSGAPPTISILPDATLDEADAYAVSADGSTVAGYRTAEGASLVACRWVHLVRVDLPDLPGGAVSALAKDVSRDGNLICGWSASSTIAHEACLWTAGTVQGLGALPLSVLRSEALAVSPNRVVVGFSGPSSAKVAFYYVARLGMRSVYDVLTELGVEPAGWQLFEATGVSEDGQTICGWGLSPIGQIQAWKAVIPLAGEPRLVADLDHDGDVDGFDLALLLGQWTGASSYAPCPPHAPADFNADCKINGFDLALVLGAWG